MDIKKRYLSTIEQINADKENQIASARQKATVEIINPFNQKIEKEKATAISKRNAEFEQDKSALLKQYNDKIASLQQKCEQDKKLIIDTCDKKKAEFAEKTYKNATAEIIRKADKAIANLNGLLGKVKE